VTIDLVIATLSIRIMSDDSVSLILAERFSAFISEANTDPDILLKVYNYKAKPPLSAVKVFEAPIVEETPGRPIPTKEQFWTVYNDAASTYIVVRLKDPLRECLLVIHRQGTTWEYFDDRAGKTEDSLPYPVDGLLLYYLVSRKGGIMIHASGVVNKGRGWVFSGISGKGKTTIAGIFDRYGDRVIHDDRLILLREGDRWTMHNTPVYRDEEPRSHKIDHIWLISHGRSNISIPASGAKAVGYVLANCIQQNWEAPAISRLVSSVEDMVSIVSVSKLQFLPGPTVRDYLLAHEDEAMKTSLGTALKMLSEGNAVSVTAGGYSMWPAIKPGDKVIIEPLNASTPETGDVIALIRDGGLVIHRITGIVDDNGHFSFRTRGDASLVPDPCSDESEIAGTIKEIITTGGKHKVEMRKRPFVLNRFQAFLTGLFRLK